MRGALPLLAVLASLALVACGSEKKKATGVPIAQRFVTAAEAPGSKADPDETRLTTTDFDQFIATLDDQATDADRAEMTRAFGGDKFKSAGIDLRFYGATHVPGKSTHVASTFIELSSEDGAAGALDFLEKEASKPCPMTCATSISNFDVDGIDGARGVHRIATAKDIKEAGRPDELPSENYWMGFASGKLVFTVELFGRPGAISEDQALAIANAYYDRLTD